MHVATCKLAQGHAKHGGDNGLKDFGKKINPIRLS